MNIIENNIDHIIEYIIKNKLGFGWKNHPNRTNQGTYLSGEPFDYIIIKDNQIYCFDCKETGLKHWAIKKKDIQQAINLKKISLTKHGVICGFLIYWKEIKQTTFLEINVFEEIIKERKHVKFEDCKIFDLGVFIK